MKTVYFNVLSHLSTELSTKKHPHFVLLVKALVLHNINIYIVFNNERVFETSVLTQLSNHIPLRLVKALGSF